MEEDRGNKKERITCKKIQKEKKKGKRIKVEWESQVQREIVNVNYKKRWTSEVWNN